MVMVKYTLFMKIITYQMGTARPARVQVAGIKSYSEAKMLLDNGVDVLGFPLALPVHAEDINAQEASEIIERLGCPERCVLITYLKTCDEIVELASTLGVTNVQLHGEVTVEEIRRLCTHRNGYYLIKSIIVGPDSDRDILAGILDEYGEDVDAFIIDTFDPHTGASGATGKTHDWELSRYIVERSPKPVILAGGLNHENVYDGIVMVKPAAVDVHTGVEAADGSKDRDLVRKFVQQAMRAYSERPFPGNEDH